LFFEGKSRIHKKAEAHRHQKTTQISDSLRIQIYKNQPEDAEMNACIG
jgi:hypothetical protein